MKKKIWIAIAWLSLATIVVCLAALLLYSVNRYQWPWWYGALGVIGTLALTFGLISMAKWVRRRHHKRLVKRIVSSDQAQIEEVKEQKHQIETSVDEQWSAAMETLKNSKLSVGGNPIYALPWLLVIGESDSGKTSAIKGSGLTSLISKAGPQIDAESTETCDWWFFEDAVVLDTAGRYTLPINGDEDEKEWQQFLQLLVKNRKREPVNGIVITLPSDILIEGCSIRLQNYGRYISNRLNSLSTELKARVPVYLMLTKADHIFGFNEFAEQLSSAQQKEALGITVEQELDVPTFVEISINDLCDKITQLTLLSNQKVSCAQLSLTSEISALKESLCAFTQSAFGHGKYHEAVMLRGVYLSSAIQQQATKSVCFEGITQSEKETQYKGLFLHDFFASLLPSQRNAYQPSSAWLSAQRHKTYLYAGVSTVLIVFGFLALTYAYWTSHHQLSSLEASMAKLEQNNLPPEQSLLQLAGLKRQILHLEKELPPVYLQMMSLKEPLTIALSDAKKTYSERFQRYVVDQTNEQQLAQLRGSDDKPVVFGSVVDNLSSQLVGLNSALSGHHQTTKLSPPEGRAQHGDGKWIYHGLYESLFNAYLTFNAQPEKLRDLRVWLEGQLRELLYQSNELSWLIYWANSTQDEVSSNVFWQLPLASSKAIPGAFTKAGYKQISELLNRMRGLNLVSEQQASSFISWYSIQYIEYWRNLNLTFNQTGESMSPSERRLISLSLTKPENPFTDLQKKTLDELEAIEKISDADLESLKLTRAILDNFWAGETQDNLDKSTAFLDSAVSSLVEGDSRYFEKISKGKGLVAEFIKAVQLLNDNIDNQATASRSLGSWLSGADSGVGIEKAHAASQQLKNLLKIESRSASLAGNQMFENIYRFLLDSGIDMASCRIQSEWESEVLGPLKYLPDTDKVQRLFEKQGLLDSFLSNQLQPFVSIDAKGWKPKSLQGRQIAFKPEFFKLIERGAYIRGSQKNEYSVLVRSLPVKINKEAAIRPLKTALSLYCDSGEQSLINNNYHQVKTFNWKPSSCLMTNINVDFGGFELNKSWSGVASFSNFIQDFKSGHLNFSKEDFPDSLVNLRENKVEKISIKFEIEGVDDILSWKKAQDTYIPREIIECRK